MSKNQNPAVSPFLSELGLSLAKYSGKQLIERLGQELIRNTVSEVLCGGNLRDLTEGLTSKRVLLSNVALLVSFLKAEKEFGLNLLAAISEELRTGKLNPEQKVFLQWLMGLTNKGIQNILRSEQVQVQNYLEDLETTFSKVTDQSLKEFGELNGNLVINEEIYSLNWHSILQLFSALGAQT